MTSSRILDFTKTYMGKLGGYFSGQLTVCMILAIFYAVAFSFLGTVSPKLMGLFLGFVTLVPFVGPILGGLFLFFIHLLLFKGWGWLALVMGIFIAGQLIESNYLTPKLISKKTGLHPLVIFVSIIAGGSFFGILGMIIAVPVALFVFLLVLFLGKLDGKGTLKNIPHKKSGKK